MRLAKTLDLGEVLVETHRVVCGQIRLLALDDVFFIGLLAGEMDGMFEETEDAVRAAPVVVTMAMIAGEDARRGSADLLCSLEPAGGDAPLKRLQLGAHAFHRRDALSVLIGEAVVRMDDEHPHPGCCDGTSCTSVFGADDFSRAVMGSPSRKRDGVPRPAGHSIHGPVALWM